MPLWYHPPPVLVEGGIPAVPGGPVNPPLYYHPPPVCVDPSENAVVPPTGTAPPSGASPISPRMVDFAGDFPSPTSRSDAFGGLPPPAMYRYPQAGGGEFHAAGNFNSNMIPQPTGTGVFAGGYYTQPPQGPIDFHADLTPESPKSNVTGLPTSRRFRERVYYYDDETKEVHLHGSDSPTERCVRSEKLQPPLESNIPQPNLGHRGRTYYIDEKNRNNTTFTPNATPNTPRSQRRSRHVELTREGSGEVEVKLWRGGDHRCEKSVRIVRDPGDSDDVDIKLSECQKCDAQGYEKNGLDEMERRRQHREPVVKVDEQELKKRIRQEEYEKAFKAEIYEELKREDVQHQELIRMQKLRTDQRAEKVEAECQAAKELERERICKEVEIELERRDQAHKIELEVELQIQEKIRKEAKQRELLKDMEERRQAHLIKVEIDNKKKLEENAKNEARRRECMLQDERDRIRQKVNTELEKREQSRLAEIEGEEIRRKEKERIEEETRDREFAIEMEKKRLSDLAEIAAEKKRKAEEQQKAEADAYQHKLDQERRAKIEEEHRVRREEWEKLRDEEMQRIRVEIAKELSETEAKRIHEEHIKSETIRLQQLEMIRMRSDEQVRIRVEAGREELRRELRREWEQDEKARKLQLAAEAAAFKAKADAEEQARIRNLAEAQKRQRIQDQIAHEEAINRQQHEQAEMEMRKQARAHAILLEQERIKAEVERLKKKKHEDEIAMETGKAVAIAEEDEIRRIIRAEIKEDMRKARAREERKFVEQSELMNRPGGNNVCYGVLEGFIPPPPPPPPPMPKERVQLHWETNFGEGYD